MIGLPVNEVFTTVQGEATHAGRPAMFIRLQGCPVGCPWCDTKFTWDDTDKGAGNEISAEAMLAKDHSGTPTWARMDLPALVDAVADAGVTHVVLTGGEPCLYDLTALTRVLVDAGKSVQIETSGTQLVRADWRTWVTVSPKMHMPGGFPVRRDAMQRADEIKMPMGKVEDIEILRRLLATCDVKADVPVWLQPLSMSPKATMLCYNEAIENNFRISLQLHAYAGWR